MMEANKDKQKELPEQVEQVIAIAEYVKERTNPDNFEVVFQEIMRIIHPPLG